MTINSRKVKIILAEKGMTQLDLSKKSGIAQAHISSILIKGRCAIATASRIATALEVSVSEIVEEGR